MSWGAPLTIKVLDERVGRDISFLVFRRKTDTPYFSPSAFKRKTYIREGLRLWIMLGNHTLQPTTVERRSVEDLHLSSVFPMGHFGCLLIQAAD